ncbi:MAG: VCBS repeat-containing protein [Candidatus Thorarchaeota archaeon]|nr:VCBS repeat-containing protein [Candidatus Thorarchaeota archaeon]
MNRVRILIFVCLTVILGLYCMSGGLVPNPQITQNQDLMLSENPPPNLWTKSIYQTFSPSAIYDVNSDGTLDVIVCDLTTYNVYAFNGPDGNLLWSYPATYDCHNAGPAIGDIDIDGKPEVVVCDTNGVMFAINGESGSLLWSIDLGSSCQATPSIADIDLDGTPEVIICIDSPDYIYALNGEDGSECWKSVRAVWLSCPAIADLNNDGELEIVYTDEANRIGAINGRNGTTFWLTSPLYGEYYLGPAVGDINNDGMLDIVVGSGYSGSVVALNWNGTILWSNTTIQNVLRSSPALGDVDKDGRLEVVIGAENMWLYAFNGEDGSECWSSQPSVSASFLASPALGDIDGDNDLDVVVATNYGHVYACQGHNGSVIWDAYINCDYSCPTLGDLDNDGQLEILITGSTLKVLNPASSGPMIYWQAQHGSNCFDGHKLVDDLDADYDMLADEYEMIIGTNVNSVDSDSDLMPDWWEVYHSLNPIVNDASSDTDSDGLSNYDEYLSSTEPQNPDSDSDLMPDGWEVQYGLNPNEDDSATDSDSDSLTNLEEFYLGTFPNDDDSDDDTIKDNDEVNTYSTDPLSDDTDSDQLIDPDEIFSYGTDPLNNDSDSDTLLDGIEVHNLGTNPLSNDSDSDTMPDGWEVQYNLNPLVNDTQYDNDTDTLVNVDEYTNGTSPINPDCDSDTLLDGVEVHIHHTDPLSNDTDTDQMPDGWEVQHSLNPLINDASLDPDDDDLTNLQEYVHQTSPQNNDTDSDLMPDGWEVIYSLNPLANDSAADADSDGLLNLEEYQNSTDPINSDTDSDLIPDGWEVQYGLNPLLNDAGLDPDSDDLTNYEEYLASTNPNLSDTDSDSMPDGWELQYGLNPLVDDSSLDSDDDDLTNAQEYACLTDPGDSDSDDDTLSDGREVLEVGTNPLSSDTDSDLMPDGWEVQYGLIPLVNDASLDADGDGLTNLEEYTHGTNPNLADSDGDGASDLWEIQNGFDPNDSEISIIQMLVLNSGNIALVLIGLLAMVGIRYGIRHNNKRRVQVRASQAIATLSSIDSQMDNILNYSQESDTSLEQRIEKVERFKDELKGQWGVLDEFPTQQKELYEYLSKTTALLDELRMKKEERDEELRTQLKFKRKPWMRYSNLTNGTPDSPQHILNWISFEFKECQSLMNQDLLDDAYTRLEILNVHMHEQSSKLTKISSADTEKLTGKIENAFRVAHSKSLLRKAQAIFNRVAEFETMSSSEAAERRKSGEIRSLSAEALHYVDESFQASKEYNLPEIQAQAIAIREDIASLIERLENDVEHKSKLHSQLQKKIGATRDVLESKADSSDDIRTLVKKLESAKSDLESYIEQIPLSVQSKSEFDSLSQEIQNKIRSLERQLIRNNAEALAIEIDGALKNAIDKTISSSELPIEERIPLLVTVLSRAVGAKNQLEIHSDLWEKLSPNIDKIQSYLEKIRAIKEKFDTDIVFQSIANEADARLTVRGFISQSDCALSQLKNIDVESDEYWDLKGTTVTNLKQAEALAIHYDLVESVVRIRGLMKTLREIQ